MYILLHDPSVCMCKFTLKNKYLHILKPIVFYIHKIYNKIGLLYFEDIYWIDTCTVGNIPLSLT